MSKRQLKTKKLFFLLGITILFFAFNTLFATRPLLGFYGLVKLGELAFIILYLAKTIRHQVRFQQIALLFAVGTIFESFLAFLQYVHQGSLNGIFYFFGERTFTGTTPGIANESIGGVLILRPYGTFSHPNILAGYLLIALVLIWSFLLTQKKLALKFVAALTLIVGSVSLFLTFSRVAILLWGVLALFVLGRVLYTSTKAFRIKLIGVLVFGTVLLILTTPPFFHEVITRFTQTSFTEESVVERTELLQSSWIMIQQHPLFGVGINNFIPALAPLQKPLPLNLYLQPVHNIIVLLTAQMGIVGLGLFIWLIIYIVRQIIKPKTRTTFFVLLAIIFVTGMFDHYWLTLQQGQLLFATVIGLSLARNTD